MSKVEIYQLQKDGSQKVILTCKLVEDKVICDGDEQLADYLNKKGVTDFSVKPPQQIFPHHGRKFLEQLRMNFSSGYLNASEVIES